MFRTAVRNLMARKGRLAATAVAVVLGVAFIAGTLVLTDTIEARFNDLFADVNAGTDAYVRSASSVEGTEMLNAQRAKLDAAVVDAVAVVPGVAATHGVVEGYAQIVDKDGNLVGKRSGGRATLGMAWSHDRSLNPFDITAGRPPRAAHEVAIDRGTAKTIGYGIGDRVTVLTEAGSAPVEIVGVASFGSTDSPAGAAVVFFSSDAAAAKLGDAGKVDAVRVRGADGVRHDDLVRRISAALPDGVEVLTGSQIAAEDESDVKDGLRFFTAFLVVFAAVSLFVGSFIIYNTFSILVAQRVHELALLRALGASRRQVLAAVLAEAAVLGAATAAAGLGVGIGLAGLLRSTMGAMGIDLPDGDLAIASSTIVVAFTVGVGVCLASAIVPALRASRVAPVAAMRGSAVEPSGRRGRLVRRLTKIIGAPLPRLGIAGKLGHENATRNPRRTATTAAALTIGVGLVGMISVLAASTKAAISDTIDRVFTGDVVIDSGAMHSGGLSPDVAVRLRALPEVSAAVGVRAAVAAVGNRAVQVIGIDPLQVAKVADLGDVEGNIASMRAGTVALSTRSAREHHVAVGDELQLRFADTGAQTMRVAAIFTRNELAGDYIVGTDTFEANVHGALDFKVFVTKAPGVADDELVAAVGAVAADYPQARVQDRTDFKNEQAAMVDQILNLVLALLALALLIALIGIGNTLALSVLERTRELGLARAVGMTRSQMKASVRCEAVNIAMVGTLVGVAGGVAAAWAIAQALHSRGLTAFVVPIGELVMISAIAAVAGVVAAAIPARRAARLDVLAAIATV